MSTEKSDNQLKSSARDDFLAARASMHQPKAQEPELGTGFLLTLRIFKHLIDSAYVRRP